MSAFFSFYYKKMKFLGNFPKKMPTTEYMVEIYH